MNGRRVILEFNQKVMTDPNQHEYTNHVYIQWLVNTLDAIYSENSSAQYYIRSLKFKLPL